MAYISLFPFGLLHSALCFVGGGGCDVMFVGELLLACHT